MDKQLEETENILLVRAGSPTIQVKPGYNLRAKFACLVWGSASKYIIRNEIVGLLLVKINDQVFKKNVVRKEEKYEDLALHTSQPLHSHPTAASSSNVCIIF